MKPQFTSHLCTLTLLAATCFIGGAAHAAKVVPPPLPVGSNLVVVNVGTDPAESKRSVRAHSNKDRVKKNHMRDDSAGLTIDGEGNVTGNGHGNGNGNGNGNGKNKP